MESIQGMAPYILQVRTTFVTGLRNPSRACVRCRKANRREKNVALLSNNLGNIQQYTAINSNRRIRNLTNVAVRTCLPLGQ